MAEKKAEIFRYKAVNQKGRIVNGSLTAINEVHLHHLLEDLGLNLISSKRVGRSNSRLFGLLGAPSITLRNKVQLYFQLYQLQKAEISLTDALDYTAGSLANQQLLDVVNDMKRMISEGMSLSEAMANFTEVFGQLEVSIIKACENTGDMLAGYKYLMKYCEDAEKMQARIKKASRYPMILLSVVFIAMIILLGHVVPQITSFLKVSQGFELPFYTVALMNLSDFFQAYWYIIIIVIAIIIGGFFVLRRVSDQFLYQSDSMLLNSPVIGNLIRKTEVARFMHVLSSLYSAGIPIVKCFREARKIMGNRVLAAAADEIVEDVNNGKTIAESILNTGEFDSLSVQLIEVAEKSSGLHNAFDQIAEIYNNDVDDAIDAMVSYIEPAMTIIMAVMIFWIILAVFGPIYSVFEEIDF